MLFVDSIHHTIQLIVIVFNVIVIIGLFFIEEFILTLYDENTLLIVASANVMSVFNFIPHIQSPFVKKTITNPLRNVNKLLTLHTTGDKEHIETIKLFFRHIRKVVQKKMKKFLLLTLLKGITTIFHKDFIFFKVILNIKHSNSFCFVKIVLSKLKEIVNPFL